MATKLDDLTPNLQIPLEGDPHDLPAILDALFTGRVDVDLSEGSKAPSRDDFRRSVIIRFFNHTVAREIVLPGITKMAAVWNDGDFDVTLIANNAPIRILPRTAVWIFVTGSGQAVNLAPLGPAGDTVSAATVPYDDPVYNTVKKALDKLLAGNASTVPYDNPIYPTVKAALDKLLYVATQITSFSNNRNSLEIGQVVTSVHLAWSVNKTLTGLSINQGIGTLAVNVTSYDVTGASISTNTTWTLSATDGVTPVTASTSVAFYRKRYWGVSSSDTLDDAAILALAGSELATNFNKSVAYNATGGKYPYFCYPSSFGTPSNVTVGGLAFSDFSVAVQSFTNASGHTENYNVVRFNGIQTGANIVVVWA